VILPRETVDELFRLALGPRNLVVTVDLPTQTVSADTGTVLHFEFDPIRKEKILKGLDDIGLTLAVRERIEAFENRHYAAMPWLPGAREVQQ